MQILCEKRGEKGLEEYEMEEIAQEVTFYKEANLLSEAIDSACENYVLNKLEDGFIASCKIWEEL